MARCDIVAMRFSVDGWSENISETAELDEAACVPAEAPPLERLKSFSNDIAMAHGFFLWATRKS